MSFTSITLTGGPYTDGAGADLTGNLILRLTEPLTQSGGGTVQPTDIVIPLVSGSFSKTVFATNDPANEQVGASYEVSFQTGGGYSPSETIYIIVPYNAAGGTININSCQQIIPTTTIPPIGPEGPSGGPGPPGATGPTGPTGTSTFTDTASAEQIIRLASLQAARKLASRSDNIAAGVKSAAHIGSATVGTNLSSFLGSGTYHCATPLDPYSFPSPTGPWYASQECILGFSNGSSAGAIIGYASYTGTTLDANGNITAFTGLQRLNNATGVLASTACAYSQPFATVDVVSCADSIFWGDGSSIVAAETPMTDWFSAKLAKENRAAGLPDPGRGWRPVRSPLATGGFAGASWSNRSAGSAVTGATHGPSAVAGGTGATVCWNTGGNGNLIGDTFGFRRAIVFIERQTSGATVKVSFDGGSTFTSTIATAGSGIIMIDSGDLGSYDVRTLQVVQQSTGSAGVIVAGYIPIITDGTAGVIGCNFAQSATEIADWIAYTGWDQYIRALQPRRVMMNAAVNDLSVGASVSTVIANQTTAVGRIQAAAPATEVDLCAAYHVGDNSIPYNVGITNANWEANFVAQVAGVALATGAVFVDMHSWMGDVAIWGVNTTTTNGGTSGTVSSGGFPNVEVGMVVLGATMPPVSNPVYVSSISGNTVNFSGNTGAITAGTATPLTYTNCLQGLSQGDGIHPGDSFQSLSGVDVQQGLAQMFYDTLIHHRDVKPVAPAPGWIVDPNQWVQLTSNVFSFACPNPATVAANYQTGTRLRWSESGVVKYGVVATSVWSGNVVAVTMIMTSDYSMSASPDQNSMWYSQAACPSGFPNVFNFSATWTGLTGGTIVTQWSVSAEGWCDLLVTTVAPGTGAGTTVSITNLPIAPTSHSWGTGNCIDNITPDAVVAEFFSGSTTVNLYEGRYEGTWQSGTPPRYINGAFRYPVIG